MYNSIQSTLRITFLGIYIQLGTGSDAPGAVLYQKWVFSTGEYFTPGRQIVLIPILGYENQSTNTFSGCMVYRNRYGFFNHEFVEEYRNFG